MKLLQINETWRMHMKEITHTVINSQSCQNYNKKSYTFIECQDNWFDPPKQVRISLFKLFSV